MSAPMNDTPPAERTALYRLYDVDEQLLYVGITSQPSVRMAQHEADKDWWGEVAAQKLEWLDTREAALDAERNAIRTERPRYNHQNNPSGILSQIRPQNLNELSDSPWRPFELLANDLRSFIQDGSIRPGDKLPTVRDLMSVYSVSNPTVQRALTRLKDQGFARGRAGLGVFAALPKGFRREAATDLATQEGTIEIIGVWESCPSPMMCKALQIAPGTIVQERRWIRRIDEVPAELVMHFQHPDSTPEDVVHRTVDILDTHPPTQEFVEALRLPVHAPVLIVVRTTYTETGRVISAQEIIKSGHLLTMTYEY